MRDMRNKCKIYILGESAHLDSVPRINSFAGLVNFVNVTRFVFDNNIGQYIDRSYQLSTTRISALETMETFSPPIKGSSVSKKLLRLSSLFTDQTTCLVHSCIHRHRSVWCIPILVRRDAFVELIHPCQPRSPIFNALLGLPDVHLWILSHV
jgi:hypothetical protein